jgi:transcriptional regulator with AAA-type ATPase domain
MHASGIAHFIAQSRPMLDVLERIRRASTTSTPILVVGERGTGKDTVAMLIHAVSGRGPYVSLACDEHEATLPRRLFGYFDELRAEVAARPDEAYVDGVLDVAARGTLYLDRIDLARPGCVPILLDAIQGAPYTPLGTPQLVEQDDVRFVASCVPHPLPLQPGGVLNSRLQEAFGDEVIVLPPLAERQDDLNALVLAFADEHARAFGGERPSVSEGFVELLRGWEPPGNLWDLRRLVHEAIRRSAGKPTLDAEAASELLELERVGRPGESREHARRKRCSVLAENLTYQGKPIGAEAAYQWISQFQSYRSASRFDPRDLAERLLATVVERFYYDEARIQAVLGKLWRDAVDLVSRSLSVPASNSGVEDETATILRPHIVVSNPLGLMKSTGVILYGFRLVSKLTPLHNAVEFSQLWERVGAEKRGLAVIIADDFIGSGRQLERGVIRGIEGDQRLSRALIEQRERGVPILFIVLACVAFSEGVERIRAAAPPWLNLEIIAADMLDSKCRAFESESVAFPSDELRTEARSLMVDRIGRHLHPPAPTGFEDCQSLIVFHYNTPNDTLPILWKRGVVGDRLWEPIFPRSVAA